MRPESAEPFPSVGARGCFLSHLGVLKHARDNGYRAILLLEDDAAFTPEYISHCGTILRELNPIDWSVAYLGHRIHPGQMPGPELARTDHWRELPGDTGVETAHAMLIHQRAVEPLIDYFQQMTARPAGHPEGGPMHVDGAYSWFRKHHPEALTLITPRQYIVQRASKSDIAPSSWKDRLPLVGILRRLKNRLSRKE